MQRFARLVVLAPQKFYADVDKTLAYPELKNLIGTREADGANVDAS